MNGCGESECQTILPSKGRKCLRIKESEDLRLGTIFGRRKKGVIVNLGGCRRKHVQLDGTYAKIC